MCGKVLIKYFDTFTRFSSDIKLNESFKVSSFNWSFCFTMIFFFLPEIHVEFLSFFYPCSSRPSSHYFLKRRDYQRLTHSPYTSQKRSSQLSEAVKNLDVFFSYVQRCQDDFSRPPGLGWELKVLINVVKKKKKKKWGEKNSINIES